MAEVLKPVAEMLARVVKFWEDVEMYQGAYRAYREKLEQM